MRDDTQAAGELLIRVEAPHFTAGLVLNKAGVCIHAAPILNWCIGRPREYLRLHFARCTWRATVVQAHEARDGMESET